MYIHFFIFYFAFLHFCVWFHFISTLVLFHLYIFTFYIFLSRFYSYFHKRKTTPKKGRDITADILDPVLQPDPTLITRAFWRQNTRIHFTWSAPPLYILDPVLQPDPTTFLCI
jgi:hypothetical protein